MSKIIDGTKLDYNDVLIVPKRSKTASRKDVKLVRDFNFYHSSQQWLGIPLMAANMDATGTFAMVDALAPLQISVCLHKHYSANDVIDYPWTEFNWKYTWISIGMKEEGVEKLKKIDSKLGVKQICIDVANGYTQDFVNHCAKIRNEFSDAIIMAGNVCTPEMVQELILHGGVDIVKIGIGPGSVCTTRLVAGVGYPQFSAVLECSNIAHGLTNGDKKLGLICADGGATCAGDISKAFGANADFVMSGGLFAGCEECEGKWEYDNQENGKKISLKFYGMSSYDAQDKYNGGRAAHRASEGKSVTVPYKGLATNVAKEICGGLRSTCAYIGTNYIKNMGKCSSFVRVNRTHNNIFS